MRKSKYSISDILNDGILRIFMIFLIVISLFPFVYMLLISFMDTTSMKLTIEKIITAKWTIDNYTGLIGKDGGVFRFALNSAIVTVYACVVTDLVSVMAAYAFAKKKFFGRDKIFYVFLMSMMIPSQAILIPTFLICKKMGILNTYTVLALPTINAFGVILIRSFMKNVPNDLLEAADIDGCGEIRKFVSIVLPLVKPVLISLTIFTFINVWGSLLWPLVVASGDKATLTPAIANMKNAMSVTNYGAMMAATTLAFLPPFILYLILQKQFVEGIALSGIKG